LTCGDTEPFSAVGSAPLLSICSPADATEGGVRGLADLFGLSIQAGTDTQRPPAMPI